MHVIPIPRPVQAVWADQVDVEFPQLLPVVRLVRILQTPLTS
jgi:hypothetical protein